MKSAAATFTFLAGLCLLTIWVLNRTLLGVQSELVVSGLLGPIYAILTILLGIVMGIVRSQEDRIERLEQQVAELGEVPCD
jgi:ABC-type dipeptide/oligopeptide/nickel transport system permease subunit